MHEHEYGFDLLLELLQYNYAFISLLSNDNFCCFVVLLFLWRLPPNDQNKKQVVAEIDTNGRVNIVNTNIFCFPACTSTL